MKKRWTITRTSKPSATEFRIGLIADAEMNRMLRHDLVTLLSSEPYAGLPWMMTFTDGDEVADAYPDLLSEAALGEEGMSPKE